MAKTDLILKKIELFEKAAISGREKDFLKALGEYNSEYDPYGSDSLYKDYSQINLDDTVISDIKKLNLQDPSRLSSKEDIKDFQRRMSYYVKVNPEFNNMLTKALGGKGWDPNIDIDGIKGKRTMTAWNLYKQYAHAKSSDPRVGISKTHEEITSVGSKLLNDFRNKLRTIRQRMAKETNNFQKRYNIGPDKVKAKWLPSLQKEYGQLSAGYNQFPPELKEEFTNLAKYMQSLFGAYMRPPPEEPRSLIDINKYIYIHRIKFKNKI